MLDSFGFVKYASEAKAENISKFIKNLYHKEKQNPLCDMIQWRCTLVNLNYSVDFTENNQSYCRY